MDIERAMVKRKWRYFRWNGFRSRSVKLREDCGVARKAERRKLSICFNQIEYSGKQKVRENGGNIELKT